MKKIEHNVINSFRLAKTDIIQTQKSVLEVSKKQKEILEQLEKMKANNIRLANKLSMIEERLKKQSAKKASAPAKKVIVKRVIQKAQKKVQEFVASDDGKKFHIPACPFAQNIKPKFKKLFKSKTTALNDGYKPCTCIK